jgi:spore coat protein U-like protein
MRALAAVIALAVSASAAAAQSCTISMPDVNFGTIDLTAGINFSTTVTMTANCTGTANQTVRVCPNFNAGSGGVNGSGSVRYMLNGANQLQYNIYRNTAYTTVWGSRTWGLPPTPPTVSVALNGSGVGTRTQVARVRVPLGQGALPVGFYTSSFAGAQTRVNYGYSTAGSCAAITTANLNPTLLPFNVNATAGGGCSVTATDLDFGTVTGFPSNVDAANTISVRCPPATPYTIGLNGGLAAAVSPTARKLDNGADQITYGIYIDPTRLIGWSNTVTVPGTGNGAFQNYTAYGRIPPQATPAADIYDDTIVVTVTY